MRCTVNSLSSSSTHYRLYTKTRAQATPLNKYAVSIRTYSEDSMCLNEPGSTEGQESSETRGEIPKTELIILMIQKAIKTASNYKPQ